VSGALSWPLQRGLYAALVGDAEVLALTEGRVFDEAPAGAAEGVFVLLGEETARPFEGGAVHEAEIVAGGGVGGFAEVKRLAGAVARVVEARPTVEGARVVDARFAASQARRLRHERRVELRFRIVLEKE
jgi:hypothetical protein